MKLNKIMKIVVTLLLLSLILVSMSQVVMAETINPTDPDAEISFNQKDNSGASAAAKNVIGAIINIAQVIGMGVAIIMLVVLAIQYIAASPEGKAEIKKNSTVYIVGAIILFAASGILGIIRRFAVSTVGAGVGQKSE